MSCDDDDEEEIEDDIMDRVLLGIVAMIPLALGASFLIVSSAAENKPLQQDFCQAHYAKAPEVCHEVKGRLIRVLNIP
jgi:hypothetical protein